MGDRICVMKDGHIMQVADPVTLYERPANAFVAGFIGMPEMNLAPAMLSFDGVPKITMAGQTIAIAEGLAERLELREGPVTFGIRPQHVEFMPADTPDALTGKVNNIEFMGHEVNLHVDIGEAGFIAVIPNDRFDQGIRRGDRVALRPIGAQVHLFDQESSANISLSEASNPPS